MKLNIEELAREADLSTMTADAHCREDYWTATRAELEAFAGLIVERCAQECESLFDLDDDSCNEAEKCAAAIRNLMED